MRLYTYDGSAGGYAAVMTAKDSRHALDLLLDALRKQGFPADDYRKVRLMEFNTAGPGIVLIVPPVEKEWGGPPIHSKPEEESA